VRHAAAFLCLAWLLAVPLGAGAITIDLSLDVDATSSPGQLLLTIGLDTPSGATAINGYTLGYDFDPSELAFVGAEQLVSFAGLGVLPFGPDCATTQRCTAGNVPTFDSGPVGPLLTLTFDVLATADDGLVDFTAGVLDPVFEGVTQPTGDPLFIEGSVVVSHAVVPEPATGLLLLVGLLAGQAMRRR